MKERLIGGRLVGVTWRWHSKRRRLLHRLAVRLGIIEPPVHRVSALTEVLHGSFTVFSRQLLDMSRPVTFKPGSRIAFKVRDAEYAPFVTTNPPPAPPPPPSC